MKIVKHKTFNWTTGETYFLTHSWNHSKLNNEKLVLWPRPSWNEREASCFEYQLLL